MTTGSGWAGANSESRVRPKSRISIEHVAAALRKARHMDLTQKAALMDEIYREQPNLLGSCLVQTRLGADEQTFELLLNILFVCYLAMRESEYEWPTISESEQERQLERTVGAIQFSEQLADPAVADAARAQYVAEHPEQPLLALVVSRCTQWLQDLQRNKAEKESDKFVMLAAFNLVNCIAHAPARLRQDS